MVGAERRQMLMGDGSTTVNGIWEQTILADQMCENGEIPQSDICRVALQILHGDVFTHCRAVLVRINIVAIIGMNRRITKPLILYIQ